MTATGDFALAMPKDGVSIAFAPHDRTIWSVDEGTRKTTPVTAGSVLIHADRDFVWHYREKRSEWLSIEIEPEVLSRIAHESGLSDVELEYQVLFSDSTILNIAQLFKAEVVKSGVAEEIYVESLRNLLAVHLIRNYSSIGQTKSNESTTKTARLNALQVKQLQDFIEDNLDQKISIAQLSAIVHLSQFYFARAFKEAVGTTPHRYLVQRRIERAKILLKVTKFSVQEIAIRVGFVNVSHFTRQFRKYVGATPAIYRKSI